MLEVIVPSPPGEVQIVLPVKTRAAGKAVTVAVTTVLAAETQPLFVASA